MKYLADKNGYYDSFGGAFIPEMLQGQIIELQTHYQKIIKSLEFQKSFKNILKNYVGRPTPLFFSKKYSDKYGGKIYLKREDLNHTGSHKINNTVGQSLLAKILGKKKKLLLKQVQDNME